LLPIFAAFASFCEPYRGHPQKPAKAAKGRSKEPEPVLDAKNNIMVPKLAAAAFN
jgi:hypothetical protein